MRPSCNRPFLVIFPSPLSTATLLAFLTRNLTSMAFSQILGQDKAQRLLTRARASGRLAHAYLFTGPAGVGKKTLAKDFATSLLCQ